MELSYAVNVLGTNWGSNAVMFETVLQVIQRTKKKLRQDLEANMKVSNPLYGADCRSVA